jgi:hypothetical protein
MSRFPASKYAADHELQRRKQRVEAMTATKPSERAMAAAKAVAEEVCQHMETVFHDHQGSTDHVNETTFAEAAAPIIDEHCPDRPGYDGMLAAVKDLRGALLDSHSTTIRCQCALHKADAVLAAAKEPK